jgi:Flp pilus assembly pilin Flp
MNVAATAGLIAVVLIAAIGFMVSTEIAEWWDRWVISRTRVLTEEDED